jgi:hypothetical protein
MLGVLAATVTLATGASAAGASAEMNGMADKGHFFVSADRVFGITWTQLSSEVTRNNTTETDKASATTTVGLLWNSGTGSGKVAVAYLIPRVGIDFTVIDGLTVGGNIGYTHSSGSYESTTKNGSVSTTVSGDTGTSSGFLFAPRVGYILPLGAPIGLWLRGGLTYYNHSNEDAPDNNGNKDSNTWSGLGLNLDPQFVVTPVEHLFFTAGLAVDIPLTGSYETKNYNGAGTAVTTTYDHYKFTNIGLTFGVGGYL